MSLMAVINQLYETGFGGFLRVIDEHKTHDLPRTRVIPPTLHNGKRYVFDFPNSMVAKTLLSRGLKRILSVPTQSFSIVAIRHHIPTCLWHSRAGRAIARNPCLPRLLAQFPCCAAVES